jgi:hypothetical protein
MVNNVSGRAMEPEKKEFVWKRHAKNAARKDMTRRAIRSCWETIHANTPFDSSKSFVALTHLSLPMLVSMVINNLTSSNKLGIEDPIQEANARYQLPDTELMEYEIAQQLATQCEETHNSYHATIEDWLGPNSNIETWLEIIYEGDNMDTIKELGTLNAYFSSDPTIKRLRLFYNYKPNTFEWMWRLYLNYREDMCINCQKKISFSDYFKISNLKFYTYYTSHETRYMNVGDFLHMVYKAVGLPRFDM